MPIKQKKITLEMQSYSIVGDLISYLRCPHAYRKIQKGNLTPSRPSQLWFGNFMHGVMESLYELHEQQTSMPIPLRPCCLEDYNNQPPTSPNDIDYFELFNAIQNDCNFECPQKICLYKVCYDCQQRLAAQGIYARSRTMVTNAIYRIYLLLEMLGKDLIPLISAAEIPLKGIRLYEGDPLDLTKFASIQNCPKKIFYEIHGIVDVITQITLQDLENSSNAFLDITNNRIIQKIGYYLYPKLFSDYQDQQPFDSAKVLQQLNSDYPNGFEIILDYKGQSRPEIGDKSDWNKHEWQIRTYKWLREQQNQKMPVIGGILLYLNEIYPSKKDLGLLTSQSINHKTDIPLNHSLISLLNSKKYSSKVYFQNASEQFRLKRAIRFIDLNDKAEMEKSIEKFDRTVLEIQICEFVERLKGNLEIWTRNEMEQACRSCDSRHHCLSDKGTLPSVP